jgi:hypothetical protein
MTRLVDPWCARAPASFARAVRAGLDATRLGPAFLAGYRAAVDVVAGGLHPRAGALAATEDGPVHPRTVAARWADGAVTGRKRFVTGVPGADYAVVFAVAGDGADGRRSLVAVRVDLDGPGVTVHEMPGLPFVPEVPHAEVAFDGVRGTLLPGDGWADVVKPFRTIEDVHVLAAVHGYLLGAAARSGFARSDVEALCASLAALSAVATGAPGDPPVHVALAGVLAGLRPIVGGLDWSQADPDEAACWHRDRALLDVAERARKARADAAFAVLGAGRPD